MKSKLFTSAWTAARAGAARFGGRRATSLPSPSGRLMLRPAVRSTDRDGADRPRRHPEGRVLRPRFSAGRRRAPPWRARGPLPGARPHLSTKAFETVVPTCPSRLRQIRRPAALRPRSRPASVTSRPRAPGRRSSETCAGPTARWTTSSTARAAASSSSESQPCPSAIRPADFDIEEWATPTPVRALRPGAYHWEPEQPWLRESLAREPGCWLSTNRLRPCGAARPRRQHIRALRRETLWTSCPRPLPGHRRRHQGERPRGLRCRPRSPRCRKEAFRHPNP